MQDSEKCKISRRETGFACYPGSGIYRNLGRGMWDFIPSLSGEREIMTTQYAFSEANAIQQGERSVVSPIN